MVKVADSLYAIDPATKAKACPTAQSACQWVAYNSLQLIKQCVSNFCVF